MHEEIFGLSDKEKRLVLLAAIKLAAETEIESEALLGIINELGYRIEDVNGWEDVVCDFILLLNWYEFPVASPNFYLQQKLSNAYAVGTYIAEASRTLGTILFNFH